MYRIIITAVSLLAACNAFAANEKPRQVNQFDHKGFAENINTLGTELEAHKASFSKDIDKLFAYHHRKIEDAKQRQAEVRAMFRSYNVGKKALYARIDDVSTLGNMLESFYSGRRYHQYGTSKKYALRADISGEFSPALMGGKWKPFHKSSDVESALKTADLFFTEVVIFYQKYTRPILLKNIKERDTTTGIKSNLLSMYQVFRLQAAHKWLDDVSPVIPEVAKMKSLVAALKMEDEVAILYEAHTRYLNELEHEEALKQQQDNKGLFSEGETLDFHKVSSNLFAE